jgi:PII-like signaling protein
MEHDCLKLTTYSGERDRADGAFLTDALVALYERHAIATSAVFRGAEGFGVHHHLRTDRQLTLSEDLPVVTVAVDRRERVEALLPEVERLFGHGLVTLERARMLTGGGTAWEVPDGSSGDATKLTVYVGRAERAGGTSATEAVVALLRRHGVAGATALLGVDGTAGGARRRARFTSRNAEVPVMVISVGERERIAAALPELGELLPRPLVTLERVRVCKRDGATLAPPREVPAEDEAGLGLWQKLMVYAGEQTHHAGRPLHVELIHRLRAEGAAGATALRGFWGYHGDHEPHGDRFWAVRRRVPVVTVIVDRPERARRWYEIADELTARAGLVTSEVVPALRATGPDIRRGGLSLAARLP